MLSVSIHGQCCNVTGMYCEKKLQKGDCCSAVMRIETLYVRTGLLQNASELLAENSLANRTDT